MKTIASHFILDHRMRNLWRKPFYFRPTSAQPMAQPIAGSLTLGRKWAQHMAQLIAVRFTLGRRVRNLWRNQQRAVLFSAAECAAYGAINLSGRVCNLWRKLSSSSDNIRYRRDTLDNELSSDRGVTLAWVVKLS